MSRFIQLVRFTAPNGKILGANSRSVSARFLNSLSGFERTRTPLVTRSFRRANSPSLSTSTGGSWLAPERLSPLIAGDARSFSSSSGSDFDDQERWNCSHEELVERVKSADATIIDVRRVDEIQETGMMQGAHNIPLDDLKGAFELPSDKFEKLYGLPRPEGEGSELIFSCRAGVRSLNALNIAREAGFIKARHYPGGWLQWAESHAEA